VTNLRRLRLAQSLRHRRSCRTGRAGGSPLRAWPSSLAQRNIEAGDSVHFETYRQQYLSKDLLSGALLRSRS
jgi:hypothetical protein